MLLLLEVVFVLMLVMVLMMGSVRHTKEGESSLNVFVFRRCVEDFRLINMNHLKIKILAVAFMDILVGSGGIGASASAASSLAHQGSWGAILRTPTYQTNIDHIDKKTT